MELETLRVNDITPDSKVRPHMLPTHESPPFESFILYA